MEIRKTRVFNVELTCQTLEGRIGLPKEFTPPGLHGVLDHLDGDPHEEDPGQGLDKNAPNPLWHPVGRGSETEMKIDVIILRYGVRSSNDVSSNYVLSNNILSKTPLTLFGLLMFCLTMFRLTIF
jgi:hypothetical protein